MQSPTPTANAQSPPSRLIRCNNVRVRTMRDDDGHEVGTKKLVCNQALGRFAYAKGEIKCGRCKNVVEFEVFDSSSY